MLTLGLIRCGKSYRSSVVDSPRIIGAAISKAVAENFDARIWAQFGYRSFGRFAHVRCARGPMDPGYSSHQ
jgi:hypothetical protein